MSEEMNDDLKSAVVATVTYLVTNISSNVSDVLMTALEDQDQVDSNLARMGTLLPEGASPVGAIGLGTGILRTEVGIPADISTDVVRWLKENNVIQQCGRGRGKALILLRNSFTIDGDEFAWKTEEVTGAPEQAEENTATPEPEAAEEEAATTEPAQAETDTLANKIRLIAFSLGELANDIESVMMESHPDVRELENELTQLRDQLRRQEATSW